ncbi:fructose-specific PTS transporter subunit EIIC [Streptomyces sp. NPDC012510]|uniref:PTS fructose transporter subunit IIABC n=1 Tax=Streptomyces sp. NPDC012510 TaxID=3364838 RepID=UPI0036E488FB
MTDSAVPLINPQLIDLDLTAESKDAAVRALAERLADEGRVTDLDGFLADIAAREAQMPTGLEGGIGIPHARSAHVSRPSLVFARSPQGVDFGAPDGPADLIFMIAAPDGADDAHLSILSSLARRLMDSNFTSTLRTVADPAAAAALITGDPPPDEARTTETAQVPAQAPARANTAGTTKVTTASETRAPLRLVAVTSCPTGIAHTYMAAESLQQAAADRGIELTVEPQGSAGFTRLDPAVIAAADAVIFAHDVPVREKERFAGKPTVDVGVKAAISRPAELIDEARGRVERGETTAPAAATRNAPMDRGAAQSDHFGTKLRTWLMSGVSYMVPFVAAGGLLIALGFAIGGWEINKAASVTEHFAWGQVDSWAALMFQIGAAAFGFLVPVLAGYIAYGMADRPGLVPGFVGGAIALTINAGFLGGLAAGLIAGAVVLAIQRIDIPPVLRGIMPVVVIPLVSTAVVGFLMFVVIGKPIAEAQQGLTDWLDGLSGSNAILLGIVLGLMMCFDLGGPVNKVAYTFATAGIAVTSPSDSAMKIMAAVMAAGMVPPLAMALATTVRGKLFTETERENGKAAWVLGASFISEGAIPFAAADPLRVIPASMAGGAVTGALSMGLGSTLRAPHGGIFVVPLIGQPLLYLVAIAAGTAVTASLVIALKARRPHTADPAVPAGDGEDQPVPDKQHDTFQAAA